MVEYIVGVAKLKKDHKEGIYQSFNDKWQLFEEVHNHLMIQYGELPLPSFNFLIILIIIIIIIILFLYFNKIFNIN